MVIETSYVELHVEHKFTPMPLSKQPLTLTSTSQINKCYGKKAISSQQILVNLQICIKIFLINSIIVPISMANIVHKTQLS